MEEFSKNTKKLTIRKLQNGNFEKFQTFFKSRISFWIMTIFWIFKQKLKFWIFFNKFTWQKNKNKDEKKEKEI